jgi:uncharacterized protein YqjF (DUF2071 family)
MNAVEKSSPVSKESSKPFLTGHWSGLLMAQWPVDPELLRSRVPRGVELDTFHGVAYVSLVAFRFLRTKVVGLPIPFHQNFTEVNLRFYVRRHTETGVRRGVCFVSELVPRFWVAFLARALYNEQYSAVRMSHTFSEQAGRAEWQYSWERGGRRHAVSVASEGGPTPMVPGSREHFIAEHFWGYSRQRDGSTVEYEVTHPTWRIWSNPALTFEWDPEASYGKTWLPVLSKPPEFSFVAEGSDVAVSWGKKINL